MSSSISDLAARRRKIEESLNAFGQEQAQSFVPLRLDESANISDSDILSSRSGESAEPSARFQKFSNAHPLNRQSKEQINESIDAGLLSGRLGESGSSSSGLEYSQSQNQYQQILMQIQQQSRNNNFKNISNDNSSINKLSQIINSSNILYNNNENPSGIEEFSFQNQNLSFEGSNLKNPSQFVPQLFYPQQSGIKPSSLQPGNNNQDMKAGLAKIEEELGSQKNFFSLNNNSSMGVADSLPRPSSQFVSSSEIKNPFQSPQIVSSTYSGQVSQRPQGWLLSQSLSQQQGIGNSLVPLNSSQNLQNIPQLIGQHNNNQPLFLGNQIVSSNTSEQLNKSTDLAQNHNFFRINKTDKEVEIPYDIKREYEKLLKERQASPDQTLAASNLRRQPSPYQQYAQQQQQQRQPTTKIQNPQTSNFQQKNQAENTKSHIPNSSERVRSHFENFLDDHVRNYSPYSRSIQARLGITQARPNTSSSEIQHLKDIYHNLRDQHRENDSNNVSSTSSSSEDDEGSIHSMASSMKEQIRKALQKQKREKEMQTVHQYNSVETMKSANSNIFQMNALEEDIHQNVTEKSSNHSEILENQSNIDGDNQENEGDQEKEKEVEEEKDQSQEQEQKELSLEAEELTYDKLRGIIGGLNHETDKSKLIKLIDELYYLIAVEKQEEHSKQRVAQYDENLFNLINVFSYDERVEYEEKELEDLIKVVRVSTELIKGGDKIEEENEFILLLGDLEVVLESLLKEKKEVSQNNDSVQNIEENSFQQSHPHNQSEDEEENHADNVSKQSLKDQEEQDGEEQNGIEKNDDVHISNSQINNNSQNNIHINASKSDLSQKQASDNEENSSKVISANERLSQKTIENPSQLIPQIVDPPSEEEQELEKVGSKEEIEDHDSQENVEQNQSNEFESDQDRQIDYPQGQLSPENARVAQLRKNPHLKKGYSIDVNKDGRRPFERQSSFQVKKGNQNVDMDQLKHFAGEHLRIKQKIEEKQEEHEQGEREGESEGEEQDQEQEEHGSQDEEDERLSHNDLIAMVEEQQKNANLQEESQVQETEQQKQDKLRREIKEMLKDKQDVIDQFKYRLNMQENDVDVSYQSEMNFEDSLKHSQLYRKQAALQRKASDIPSDRSAPISKQERQASNSDLDKTLQEKLKNELFLDLENFRRSDVFKLFGNKRLKEIAMKYFHQTFVQGLHDLCRIMSVMTNAKALYSANEKKKKKQILKVLQWYSQYSKVKRRGNEKAGQNLDSRQENLKRNVFEALKKTSLRHKKWIEAVRSNMQSMKLSNCLRKWRMYVIEKTVLRQADLHYKMVQFNKFKARVRWFLDSTEARAISFYGNMLSKKFFQVFAGVTQKLRKIRLAVENKQKIQNKGIMQSVFREWQMFTSKKRSERDEYISIQICIKDTISKPKILPNQTLKEYKKIPVTIQKTVQVLLPPPTVFNS